MKAEQLTRKLFHFPRKDDESLVYNSDYSNGKKKKTGRERGMNITLRLLDMGSEEHLQLTSFG